ncbi:bifunctional acetate--CoA ligase family protein/GNAT family N-acetyltransferase [Rhodoferax sp.]|uniref:bifunctional acetate--CoA ligase family protein/GNAT family N-acetyltransferase n=1 Tax=Rhodoferax sp. TaxID=50421 RepID=UPI002632F1D4|nr:bifunctional acetate--CoA ligase family protein/GNAT family N-acetyltransferase [Rhodoferax sp.]MDD3937580.1 bifunctional acetate--CoA ligase family protein/GNAT family N-acetyltransferase [Rhodoferax sp.]
MDKHYLAPLFAPQSILVFAGPTESVEGHTPQARQLVENLKAQAYKGTLHFLDIHSNGTLADLARTRADLAIIALPEDEVLAALEVAGRMNCRSALIISTGISAELAQSLEKVAKREDVQLLGPNCLGFQNPLLQLNASVAGDLASSGSLALVSQSGALTASMLDWASKNAVGFSSVVSLGSNTAVDISQVLDYLANDARTQSIIVYLESISNARRFMSALRSAANTKPVIVLKAGRKPAGNQAAQTNSGTFVGSDNVFDAALRRAGAVRVTSFVELFSAAKCLASRYRPVGQRLAIVTNGGGPGMLAVDWVYEIHLHLGKLSDQLSAELKPKLPVLASLTDLIDLSEEATAEHYKAAVSAAYHDASIDGVLVIFSPKTGSDSIGIAKAMAEIKRAMGKPLLSCWMGDATVGEARVLLNEAAIPTFRTPEAAVGAFGNIATFYQNQRLLQQTPPPLSILGKPDIEGARLIIESVVAERRKVLTDMESKTLLSCFHIPVTQTILARNANEVMMISAQLGFPVALKIDSPDISDKSDVQGVALNIMNATSARDNYNDMVERVKRIMPQARINGVTVQKIANARRGRKIYVGLVTDDPFGPVIVFGAGGTMIELLNDRAMELPPLNQFLARRLIDRSRVSETLGEWRGASAVNMDALEQVLLRVSEMVCELPHLREMDINPIIVDESGAVAVDARIVINSAPQASSGRASDYHHLSILPYPARYERTLPLRGGGEYSIRPIHPDDAQMLKNLLSELSPQSRRFRFVSSMAELPPAMLARFTLIDYDREMALAAVVKERKATPEGDITETERIVGVSRYVTNPDQSSCDFALVVADDFTGKGMGSRLMESIMDVAREKGLSEIEGLVLAHNSRMLKLMRGLGYQVKAYPGDPDFKLVTHSL